MILKNLSRFLTFLNKFNYVKRIYGIGFGTQIIDILRCRLLINKLGISDYYNYRLFDKKYIANSSTRDFIGWRLQLEISKSLNKRQVTLPAWDKLAFMIYCKTYAIPCADNQAIYIPSQECNPILDSNILHNIDDLRYYFSHNAKFPLFGKPCYAQQGIGSTVINTYNEKDDELVLYNGDIISISHFFDNFINLDHEYYQKQCGYLFQSTVNQHPIISEYTGTTAVSGLRVVLINHDDRASVIGALWKIITNKNITDNLSYGETGNLIANIDVDTGKVKDPLTGFWPYARVVTYHPDTKKKINGITIPKWNSIVEQCKKTARFFPLMRIQFWDIAIVDSGALFLELNDLGGLKYLQLYGKGFLSKEVRDALRLYGSRVNKAWVDKI